jgi:type IV pilus assembly protein PilX
MLMQTLSSSLPKQPRSFRNSQTGVALIVVLIFIVAFTSLALYSARDVSLGERLARNQLDAQVAREAAEAALRDAEFDLMLFKNETLRTGAYCFRGVDARPVNSAGGITGFSATCSKGQCNLPEANYSNSNYSLGASTLANFEPWWPAAKGGLWNDDLTTKPTGVNVNCSFNGGVPYGTFTGRASIIGVSRQPEYLIELFTRNPFSNSFVRITARGFGRNPNTEIVLQSYFRPFQ